MPPVFRQRCERDGLEEESSWLGEEDLEPDVGDPVPLEQPTQIVTRPLSTTDRDDRIRAIFGLLLKIRHDSKQETTVVQTRAKDRSSLLGFMSHVQGFRLLVVELLRAGTE